MFKHVSKGSTVEGARAILAGARDILGDGRKWTSGVRARDRFGRRVNVMSPKAGSYCVIGAMQKTRHKGHYSLRSWRLALKVMRKELGGWTRPAPIMGSNDSLGYPTIRYALDRAIAGFDHGLYDQFCV